MNSEILQPSKCEPLKLLQRKPREHIAVLRWD
jgi:hypothetical protein